VTLAGRPSVRSFERRVAFRIKPPGQPGRPRKHYPPVFRGRPYEAKLVATVRAVYHDPEIGRGEFAVVREAGGYRVWQCDEDLSDVLERKDAFRRATMLARKFDRDEAHFRRTSIPDHIEGHMQAEIDRLNALSNDEKVASGGRMRSVYGEIWRGLENVLVLHPDTGLCLNRHRQTGTLRPDVAEWCRDNGLVVKIRALPFANARVAGYVVPVYCYALAFEDPNHPVWFKLVWWGEDDREHR
jgi:hypothetical protein